MIFNFINFTRRSLILALKSGSEFFVFKTLSVCLSQRCSPREDIADLVTLKNIWFFEILFTVSCRIIVFYNFEFILKGFWY